MIRRIGTFACAILLCFAATVFCPAGGTGFLAAPWARAEEAPLLEIQVNAKPSELVEPGDVTLSFSIVNASGLDAQNVYLSSSDGLLSEPIGQIAAGDSQSFTRTHSVTQAELDAGEIGYTVSCDDPEDPDRKINYTIHASIHQSDRQPQVEFTRQLSSRYVVPGDTLTITYRVRNTGNVALNALRVQDTLGDFTGRVELLDVGASHTFISRVTLSEEAVSAPSLSYVVNALDGQSFIETLTEAVVQLARPQIEAQFSADYSAFSDSTAEVVLLLTNQGNVDYLNVRVMDDIYGGVIAGGLQIPKGSNPVEVSRAYPVRGDGGFRWRISGMSAAGERFELVTDTRTLEPREIDVLADVRLQATAETPRIRRAGSVGVRLRIENEGGADITDVALSEESLGELRRFAIVPAGGAIDCALDLEVAESTQFRFQVRYTDAEGWQSEADCDPVEVTIAADGVLPKGAKEGFIEFTGDSIKIGGSSLFAVLMIAGCVVLIVLVVILIVASRRARIERQLRIAEARMRRREDGAKARKSPQKQGRVEGKRPTSKK